MKPYYILSLSLMLFLSAACKQEAGNEQPETGQQVPAPTNTQEVDGQNNTAALPLSEGHDYTFLTDKLFHFKAAFGGSTEGAPLYKDEWIDLDADGTFKAGKLKEQTHTGKWGYNHDAKVLLLKPDVNTFKITEWKVMYNEQMMVWVGTQTYGNNSVQIKLERSEVLP